MTFGIDISTHQATLDLAAAREAGAEFVIVKSVASYRPELTIADDYHEGIDRALVAGFGNAKGHYAVPNSRNTPEATAQFQMSIAYKAADSDVFMLDNEPLDTYKTYWRDDAAAAYFEELHRLGVRYPQMWLYCPAALTRSSGPWPKIEALRKLGLKIVWVSYGDNDPLREDGEEPLLGGGITGWDVHQFTSTWRVPGYDGNVDGNYTPHSVAELFGGDIVPLRNYRLRSPSVVIADDNRDPYVSWANHLNRTGRGGIDIVAAVGTPIYARTAGRMIQIPDDGTAGNSCRFYHRDNTGWKDVFSHLSSYRTPKNPQGLNAFDYEAGDIVAYSGNSGNVVQHLHWHLLDPDSVRRNPWDYFSESGLAGIDPTPITETILDEKEDDMFPVINTTTSKSYTIGRQFIRHEPWAPSFDVTTKVLTADDKAVKLDAAGFAALLASFGIPASVIDARGFVVNPHTNVMESGGKWSIGDVTVAELRKIITV